MSLMGSDTLPGTPGNQNATLTPILYNGVYYICVGTYINREPNFACTFFYNFINTSGSDFNGATMSVSFDNYGYVVLNGVKYPSTNPNMSLGYEGIGGIFIYDSLTNFTVTIPKGLNSLELRCVNMPNNPELNVWESQGLGVQPNNPSVAWLRITSSTSTVLVNTDATWRCTQFNYPAKFIGPVSLGDVAENAGLSRPYSLAALSGKVMYDNSRFSTTLASPVALHTTTFKTFVYPGTSTQFNWVSPNGTGIGNYYAWDVPIPVVNGTYSCRAVDPGNSSRFFSWTTTISGGTITITVPTFTGFVTGARIHSMYSIPSYSYLYGTPANLSVFHTVDNLSLPPQTIVPGFFCLDFFHINQTDAIYVLTVTKTG